MKIQAFALSGSTLTQFRYVSQPTLEWLAPTLEGKPLPDATGRVAFLECSCRYPYGHVAKNFAIDFQRKVEVSAEGRLQFKRKERP